MEGTYDSLFGLNFLRLYHPDVKCFRISEVIIEGEGVGHIGEAIFV